MFGVGDGPPSLAGLDGLILASQTPFETTITCRALFVTLLFLLFATLRSVGISETV